MKQVRGRAKKEGKAGARTAIGKRKGGRREGGRREGEKGWGEGRKEGQE